MVLYYVIQLKKLDLNNDAPNMPDTITFLRTQSLVKSIGLEMCIYNEERKPILYNSHIPSSFRFAHFF